MKAVVDTNVVAYYLLETEPFLEECKRFWYAADKLTAPSSWQSELVNVLWLAVRQKVISESEAQNRLNFAATLSIHSVGVVDLWQGALRRSCTFNMSPYDMLFVELAEREGAPLATFDKDILKAFPSLAMHPGKLFTR